MTLTKRPAWWGKMRQAARLLESYCGPRCTERKYVAEAIARALHAAERKGRALERDELVGARRLTCAALERIGRHR